MTESRSTSERRRTGGPVYPATRYAPPPLVDLGVRATRAHLGPAALRSFFKIAVRWQLSAEEARLLLGGPPRRSYRAWQRHPKPVPGADTLTRLSCLTGIFEALNILYGERLADRWVGLPNRNPLFAGGTPLAYMISGGIPALLVTRRLLDARQAGA